MALPVNNVNTVGGAEIPATQVRVEPKHCRLHKETFSQIFQHYVEVNARSAVPAYVQTGGFDTYSEGWYHIDYTRLHAGMCQADRDVIKLCAKKYRICDQGFRIKRINCIQQNVAVSAATATINASFQSAPSVMVFKDTDNDVYQATYRQGLTMAVDSDCVWADTSAGPNSSYTETYASTIANGALQEVKISRPNGLGAGVVDQPRNFSLMHGGDIEWISPGDDKYSHHWENKSNQWFSPNLAESNLGLGQNQYQQTTGIVNTSVQMFENAATGIPDPHVDIPEMILIRAPPVRDSLGLINMVFELMIEYYTTIEWMSGRYLNHYDTNSAPSNTIVDTKRWYNTNRRHLVNPISNLPTVRRLQRGATAV